MTDISPIESVAAAAIEAGASDLFLAEGQVPRFRIAGSLHTGGEEISPALLLRFWKACGADEEALQHDTAWTSPGGCRFRVNLHRTLGKRAAAMRPVRTDPPTMGSLGLPVDTLLPWLEKRSGIILITGPTGSGKSTTIAAALEWVNQNRSCHIVTIEDPIEFIFSDARSFFTQREVGIDVKSYPDGLRGALRQAPNIIFLGEIRDEESALTALQAAETGHLVISTLHSSDVAETLERIVGMAPESTRDSFRALFARQAVGLMCQRLLPRADGQGVTLVAEYLEIAGAVREWLRTNDTASVINFLRRGENPSNSSFTKSMVLATQAGTISRETALEHSLNQTEFLRMLRGIA